MCNVPSVNKEVPLSERAIVALDVPAATQAREIVAKLGDSVGFYKVGLQLFTSEGPDFVRRLQDQDKRIFLDLKFYDIGKTVALATERVAELGVDFLTVHAEEQSIEAAAETKGERLKILAVTLLTSLDEASLRQNGITLSVEELVLRRARFSLNAGADGLIASPREVSELRRVLGNEYLIVTPGVRSEAAEAHDQKRTATPYQAIVDGSDHVVVGREITQANDPSAATAAIHEQIERALSLRV